MTLVVDADNPRTVFLLVESVIIKIWFKGSAVVVLLGGRVSCERRFPFAQTVTLVGNKSLVQFCSSLCRKYSDHKAPTEPKVRRRLRKLEDTGLGARPRRRPGAGTGACPAPGARPRARRGRRPTGPGAARRLPGAGRFLADGLRGAPRPVPCRRLSRDRRSLRAVGRLVRRARRRLGGVGRGEDGPPARSGLTPPTG